MAEKATVLIVDDDSNYVRATVDLLNEKGFDSIGVHSGHEAIDKVREMAFDVVLLDVRMPLMDGIETYRELKKISPQTALVFVTAYRADQLAKDALREGEYGLLYKPIDIDRVAEMIERARQGGLLIMVADDDPNTFEALKDHLETQGYVVGLARNYEEATGLASRRRFDVAFIDARLPDLNGLVLYLEMKRVNPNVVAVMMTGRTEQTKELVDEALEQGAHACLYKPFSIGDVTDTLENIIKAKKGGD